MSKSLFQNLIFPQFAHARQIGLTAQFVLRRLLDPTAIGCEVLGISRLSLLRPSVIDIPRGYQWDPRQRLPRLSKAC